MWVQIESLDELKHGDRIKGRCIDGKERKGTVDTEWTYQSLPTFKYGSLSKSIIIPSNVDWINAVIISGDDIAVDRVKVWRVK